MATVALSTVFEIVFAAGIVVAVLVLGGTALRRLPARVLVTVAAVLSAAAVGAWIVFAFKHGTSLALSAGGLTACVLIATGSLLLRDALARIAALDERLERSKEELYQLVAQEAAARAAELERTLARARADSASMLEEQERRFADDRRRVYAERERGCRHRFAA